jgi:hypothetical protein
MDPRSALVNTIGDLTFRLPRGELGRIYYILDQITEYIDTNENVQKEQILSVLRNISSNVLMVQAFRVEESFEYETKESHESESES